MGQFIKVLGSRSRRLLAAVLLLTGVVTTVPMLAGVASAHHAEGSASVNCDGLISWTAISWGGSSEASKTNANIRVSFAVTPNNLTAPATVNGAFNKANNYQFSGTANWPAGATQIVVSFKDIGSWGFSPNYLAGPSGSQTNKTISLPTNCGGSPAVTKNAECVGGTTNGSGTVVFTLTNPSTSPFANSVTYSIPAFNGVAATTVTVAKGTTSTKTYTLVPDGNYTVAITSSTAPTNQTQTFTVDCDSPVPSVSNVASCVAGNGKIIVTLKNDGGEAVTFAVTSPTGNVTTNHVVAANSSKPVEFTGLADATYTIVIVANGVNYNQTFTVDCDQPAPVVSAVASCDSAAHDGKVIITLSNTAGTEGVTFKVTNPFTNVVEDVVVAAGASTTRTFTGFSDGTKTVAISVPGNATNFNQTFTVACDLAPTYSYTSVCVTGDGVVTVTMKNDGDDVNAIFILQGTTHTLVPGETKVVALPPMTDGLKTITLTVNGANKNFNVTIDCDRPGQPAVDIAQVCANEDGTANLTLKNIGGQLSLDFFVNNVKYTVPANSQVIATVTGLLDGSNTIVVTQGQTNFNKTITVACDTAPTVTHSQSCVDGTGGVSNGQVVITLNNNGDDASVVFTVNGTPTAPVPPKGSVQVTVGGLADGPHNFTVSGGGKTFDFSVTIACDKPGTPSITTSQECSETNDGTVKIQLTATGGEKPVIFFVNGTEYTVNPGPPVEVIVTGLNDGLQQKITVTAGDKDLSFFIDVKCDKAPKVTASASCTNYDGLVSVLLENLGDDVAVTFVVNGGTPEVVAVGDSKTVEVAGLVDGAYSITLTIDGVPQPPLTGVTDCDPVVGVTAVCNSVDTNGAVALYWYSVTNTAATELPLTWDGGSTTIAIGASKDIGSTTKPLSLKYLGTEIASAQAAEVVCTRDVKVEKVLVGQPPTGETYRIRVSRLTGDAEYDVETEFDLLAGIPATITLPSTLDPAGIEYKIEEINAGTAATSNISQDVLKLAGHLGETISVVVTNGYASVQIDKQSLTQTVLAGGTVTYTLQATNTGGLTLNPVVITDRLPEQVEFQSVVVADNAGTCALAESTRPQLLVCTMFDALAPAGVTKMITLTVKVDGNVASGTQILNQAKVLGTFEDTLGSQAPALTDLTCLPVIAGTVCDLSATVGVPVSEIAQEGPTTTTTTISRGQLPSTGGNTTLPLLALALGLASFGGALLLSRRRTAS